MNQKGTLWLVKIGTKTLIGQRDLNRNTTTTKIPTSSKTTGDDETSVPGRRNTTISLSGIAADTKESTDAGYWELYDAQEDGTLVTISETEYTTNEAGTPVVGSEKVSYTAWVSSLDASYPDNAEKTFSCGFEVTGPRTRTTNAGS